MITYDGSGANTVAVVKPDLDITRPLSLDDSTWLTRCSGYYRSILPTLTTTNAPEAELH